MTSALIEEHIAKGAYYEALQLYRTLYARSIVKEAKHAALIGELEKGAGTMLRAGESNCAIELLELLFTAYDKAHVAPSDERVAALQQLFEQLPPHKYTDNKCQALLKHVAAWSKAPQCEHGAPALHNLFARKFADAADLMQANAHYLRGNDAAAHVALIRRWADEAAPSERDLLFARAVLQALCFDQLYAASELHAAALADARIADSPLTHAIGFVVSCCERDAGPLFTELRSRYAGSFARDPAFAQYLDAVGKRFFAIQPAAAPPNMMTMLQQMLGGGR
jgi:hypothetical protein